MLSRVLILSAAVLVLNVYCEEKLQVRGPMRSSDDDDDPNSLLKALIQRNSKKNDLEDLQDKNHEDDDDDERLDTSELYERSEYIEEMMRYQDIENERADDDVFRSDDSLYVEGRVMNSLSAAQQQEIINMHNDFRRKEGASNMEIMRFNPKLARIAQTWAQGCSMGHGHPPFSASDVGWAKDKVGQSYAIHSDPKWKPTTGVQAWFDEKKDYNFNNPNGCALCGHYTALVWADTTDIGCGIAFCPSRGNSHFLICNYGPGGNYPGKTPYLKGPPCTQCTSGQFFCNKGLCDKSCRKASNSCVCMADCKRGGTTTNDCKCKCKLDSIGPNCADACRDFDPKCGRNPGYPKNLCTRPSFLFETINKECPKLCGHCEVSRDSSSNDYSLKKLMLDYLENHN